MVRSRGVSDSAPSSGIPTASATHWFLPVLTFHTIDEQPSVIAFPPEVFARGIRRLYERGYRTLSLLDAADCLRRHASFPDRCFILTFDDGYRTVYDNAFPVLQRYGMAATVFLTVGTQRGLTTGRLPSLDNRPMLSWEEMREMHRAGMAFGAHTCTHRDLTGLPDREVQAEVVASKNMIEDGLGTAASCFAYPYGRYDARVAELVRPYFVCACSDKLGLLTSRSDLYALERVDAYYLRTDRLFDIMLTPFFPWYVRMRSVPRGLRRAYQTRRSAR
jgi:peptidoglycan/xylan/chitin deacetylase (PgdA/CDA1 family)